MTQVSHNSQSPFSRSVNANAFRERILSRCREIS